MRPGLQAVSVADPQHSEPSLAACPCKVGRGRRRSLVGAGLALALGAACTFIPPPALPEELAAQEAEAAARRQAVRGGEPGLDADGDVQGERPPAVAEGPEGEPGAGEGGGPKEGEPGGEADPSGYRRGEPADLGMTPEQMRAYAQAQGDPEAGDFTLAEALAGLPGRGQLWVEMQTTQGTIACRLFETQTPLTVANFVGLARGLRPALDDAQAEWITRRYYDGVAFHRVIPGFVIQGGDPTGTGRGDTGYVIPDEIVADLVHDEAGILSMANRGPGTGAGQFFVTLAPLPHLDGKHTVFGKCDGAGIGVAEKIAAMRGPGDRPRTPQIIERMNIVRR
jgi:peptidyl-prolyl cis-trans isomerase A (cyclophilin A)